MKSIYYRTKSKQLIDVISFFCQEEGFNSFDLSKDKIDIPELNYGIIISDAEYSSIFENIKIPIAFINHPDNYSAPHYVLDENAGLIHIKMLIDSAFNGGVLSNISSSCDLKTLSYHYEISNDIYSIDKIVYNLTKDFVYFFKLSELQKIRIGISEMITNAIEHGNLEITGEEKFRATENDEYYELLKKKLSDKKLSKRKVDVLVKITKKQLKVTIKDKGKGFDTSKIKKTLSEEDLYKLHGRGILITSMYFDEIVYNNKGNVVSLIKRIQ